MEPYLPNYLKGKNRRLVFDLLRERGQMSRAEITRDTGMSFPTAMKVVDAFLEKGLLVELDETGPAAGAGRKGRLLRFEPGAYRAVGVECEGRFARVGLADMVGGVQARETIELGDFARTRDLSPLAAAIRRMCAAANGAPVLGVCIGFPANLDPDAAAIVSYAAMDIQQPTSFAQVFPAFWREVELPVYLGNDANLACEGEASCWRGAGGAANMLYLSIGSGCGGAVRLDGKLRRGALPRGRGSAMLLQPALGAPGRSAARETLERRCLAALERRFGAALGTAHSRAKPAHRPCGTIWRPAERRCLQPCDDAGRGAVRAGGIVPGALGMQLCTQVSEALRAALPESTPVRVEPSVSADAGVIGAAATVFERSLTPCSAAADGGAARRGLAQGAPQSNECKLAAASKQKRIARRSGACYNRCA
ncbi:MAG: ROK family protein [Ruthenibacterium lactatiformans]